MKSNKKKLERYVVDMWSSTLEKHLVDDIFEQNCRKTFGDETLQRLDGQRRIIKIYTPLQDYKKLALELKKLTLKFQQEVFFVNSSTRLEDLLEKRALTKLSKKMGWTEHLFQDTLLGVFGFLQVFIALLSFIFQVFVGSTIKYYFLSAGIALLGILFLILSHNYRKKKYKQIRINLNEMDVQSMSSDLRKFIMDVPLFAGQRVFIIENLRETNPVLRSFLLMYLEYEPESSQLWCILNDEKITESIKTNNIKGYVLQYQLYPLSLEEKKKLYQELGLSEKVREEYLGFIGVDWMFAEELEEYEDVKYTKEIVKKIGKLITTNKQGKDFTRALYCLVYISANLGYYMNLKTMVALVCREGQNEVNFRNLEKECKKSIGASNVKPAQMEEFLRKFEDITEDYCFIRPDRSFRFSKNILLCLENEFRELLPAPNTVRKWALIKLLGNADKFDEENYYLDCCNLLLLKPVIDFSKVSIAVLVSLTLLARLNKNYCWFYYRGVLHYLDNITSGTSEREKYILNDAVKEAVINYRILIADRDSVIFHRNYINEYSSFCEKIFDTNIPCSCMDMMDLEIEDKEVFYRQMVYAKDPTNYYYYLLKRCQEFLGTNWFYKTEEIISWDDPVSMPVEIIFDLLEIYLFMLRGNKKDNIKKLCSNMNKILAILHSKKYYTCKMMERILSEFYDCIRLEQNWNRADMVFRRAFLGVMVENTNSECLRFLHVIFSELKSEHTECYKLSNTELDLIQSFAYYNGNSMEKGITLYLQNLVDGNWGKSVKIQISIKLLMHGVPYKNYVNEFLLLNQQEVINEIIITLEKCEDAKNTELTLVLICMLVDILNNSQFTEDILEHTVAFLEGQGSEDSLLLGRILRFIIAGKQEDQTWDKESAISIADKLESKDLALFFIEKKCEEDETMILSLSKFDWITTGIFRTTICKSLVSNYLLKCDFSTYDAKLLKWYLKFFSSNSSHKWLLERYLVIIDRYEEVCLGLKEEFLENYSLCQARLFYIESLEIREGLTAQTQKKSSLLEFTAQIIGLLNEKGKIATLKTQKNFANSPRRKEIDEFIIQNIRGTNPVVGVGESALNGQYVEMIVYLVRFPESYQLLVEEYGKRATELMLNKKLIQILNIYIEWLEDKNFWQARNYLLGVKSSFINSQTLLEKIKFAE